MDKRLQRLIEIIAACSAMVIILFVIEDAIGIRFPEWVFVVGGAVVGIMWPDEPVL